MNAPASETLQRLAHILGPHRLLTAANDLQPFLTDHRALYRGHALAVAQPETAAEVAQLLAVCNQARIGVVPQGGNTGYCGGATGPL